MAEVEHVAPPVLALDGHDGAFGVDRDDLGGVAVGRLGAVVVTGELDSAPDSELLFHLDEHLGPGAVPTGGLPFVRFPLVGEEPDGASFG